jgi:pimeloyl-ACP methyl ester carboxylesterase
VDWVGTSMGGLIGMALAIQPETPIRKLVLNDVGPVITAASLERIGMYLGRAPRFDSIEQIESAVRFVSQPFGTADRCAVAPPDGTCDAQAADGKFEFAYDPGIAEPFKEVYAACAGKDVESWPLYDAIACPTLLLRGASSDLLTAGSAREMTRRGPRASWLKSLASAMRRCCSTMQDRSRARVFGRLTPHHHFRGSATSKYFMGE